MRDSGEDFTNRPKVKFAVSPSERLRILTGLARATLLAERLARALTPAAIVTSLFVAVSWTGLWLGAPSPMRIAGALALFGALAVALWPLRKLSLPRADEARAALDRDDAQAPASALADVLANEATPQTLALWRLHRRRAEMRAASLRPIRPSLRLWLLDPYALGALAVLALCAGAFVAGPEKYARVAAAFDWRWHGPAGAPVRLDVWIDPPAYTGKAALVLALTSDVETPVAAPVGSTLVVRAGDSVDFSTQGGVEPAKPKDKAVQGETRFALRGDGGLKILRHGAALAQFSLRAIPDQPPTITPLGEPRHNLRGTFTLAYRIEDDYGAHDASLTAAPRDSRVPTGHVLVAPPTGALDLPAAPGGLGEARTTLDWTDSPYAGANVDLAFQVTDDAGNIGRAELQNVTLPQKIFKNPLARALAEQRRLLALDSGQKENVLDALDALLIAPDLFSPRLSLYLELHHAQTILRRARQDAELLEVADFLWAMALQIEEGDASKAEQDLRAAEKALREALDHGASQQEIERLTAQLKKALQAYMAELAKKAPPQDARGESPDSTNVTPEDFQSMLDQLAEAARNGDKDAARALLDRMQEMLENMRAADGKKSDQKAQRDRKMLRDIDKMMREQQKLRDDTFAHERGLPPDPNEKKKPEDASAPALGKRQGELRDKLDGLQNESQGAPKSLKDAQKEMGDAEGALKKGDEPAALSAQQRALDQLRQGASEMAGKGRNGENGDEEQNGRVDQGGKNANKNPFGQDGQVGEGKATASVKARRILDELRRRLADPNRPAQELDYLERLIRPD